MEPYEFVVGPFLCKARSRYDNVTLVDIFFAGEGDLWNGELTTLRYDGNWGEVTKKYKYRGVEKEKKEHGYILLSPEQVEANVRSAISYTMGRLLSDSLANENHSHTIS
jgi:hypothetical protein